MLFLAHCMGERWLHVRAQALAAGIRINFFASQLMEQFQYTTTMSEMHNYRAYSFAGDAPQCHAVAAPRCDIKNTNRSTPVKSCHQHAYEMYPTETDMLRFSNVRYVFMQVVVFWFDAWNRTTVWLYYATQPPKRSSVSTVSRHNDLP